jgi:hypothetical protein
MPYDTAGNLQNSVSVTLGAGPYNDLSYTVLQSSPAKGIVQIYVSGSTNRIIINPAVGGTTINSLDASGCSDGFTILFVNASATDNVIFNHLGGGAGANQFSNQNGGSVAIVPLAAARCTYVVNKWQFA